MLVPVLDTKDKVEDTAEVRLPAALSTLADIKGERDSQRANFARIVKLQEEVAAKVARIDPDLRADVRGRRIRELTVEVDDDLARLVRKMRARGEDALAQLPYWPPAVVRHRARFDRDPVADATIRNTWLLRLAKAHPIDLLDFAKHAAATRDLALGDLVFVEMLSRQKFQRGRGAEIGSLIESIPNPDAKEATDALNELIDLAADALLAFQETRTGKANAMEKIASALRKNKREAASA